MRASEACEVHVEALRLASKYLRMTTADTSRFDAALAHADYIRNAVKLAEGLEALPDRFALCRQPFWTEEELMGPWQIVRLEGKGERWFGPTPLAAVEAARAALEVSDG